MWNGKSCLTPVKHTHTAVSHSLKNCFLFDSFFYPGNGAERFVDPFVPVTRGSVYSFGIQSFLAAMVVCLENNNNNNSD